MPINVNFMIFTKLVVNRIIEVANEFMSPSQTAFMPERNIMEGIVILHETLHELHRKNEWSDPKTRFQKSLHSFLQAKDERFLPKKV
jgi:hypothetical protein